MKVEHVGVRHSDPRRGGVAVLIIGLIAMAGVASAEPARDCAALIDLSEPDAVIETATIVPAGSIAGRPGLPEHCLVQGMIDPRIGADGNRYGVGFDLRMPTDWNGRFVFQGGGGLDGVLNPAYGDIFGALDRSALARGFAVVSTDGGHRGRSMIDASFAVDQQARVDYAFGAMDSATRKGKALVEHYYGTQPEYAYLLGCSNGGRQGLMAAQRFPLHFDGIVAGNPAFKLTRIAMNQTSNIQIVASIAPRNEEGRPILSRAFGVAQLEAAGDAILARCDALDGLADGMINDWQACDFDPGELACSVNSADTCLTAEQVDAMRNLHRGPVDGDGRPLYGQFVYDTGIAGPAWRRMRMGSATDGTWDASDVTLGFETLRQYAMTPPDPAFDPMTFDFAVDHVRTEQMRALGDADATYLQTYRNTGRMIVYHGNSDEGMATGALTDWYDAVLADNGEDITDAVRLFLIPGMTHCGGGMSTDRFDMLTAIQAWVEEGRAPDRIIATGERLPGVSRPLCPYPLVARYQGGDPDDAASFSCLP
jgi:pimeloyl-ACP methyl ester carboxylesterase